MSKIVLVSESIFLDYEEITIVCAHEVHKHTLQGWKLLCPIADDGVQDGTMEVPNDSFQNCPQCGSYSNNTNQTIHGSVVVRHPLFIMGMSRDDVTADLRKRLQTTHDENLEKGKELKELKEEKEIIKRDRDYRVKDLEREQKENKRMRGELEKKDKLEKDLGKARKYFGEKEFDKSISEGEDTKS